MPPIPKIDRNFIETHLVVQQKQISEKIEETKEHYKNLDTQLYDAVKFGHIDKIKPLMEKGAVSRNYIWIAIRNKRLDSIKELVKCGDKITGEHLICASSYGRLDIVEYFVENKMDVNYYESRSLMEAIHNFHWNVAEYLIKHGADVNANNNLITTIHRGNFEIAKLLLEHGAKVDEHDNDAIYQASSKGNLELVKLLLQYGAKPYSKSNKILQAAVSNNHFEVAKFLISKGAYINELSNTQKKKLQRFNDIQPITK